MSSLMGLCEAAVLRHYPDGKFRRLCFIPRPGAAIPGRFIPINTYHIAMQLLRRGIWTSHA
jgi:hypothetical protein